MHYLRGLVHDIEVPYEDQLTNWINDNPFRFICTSLLYDRVFEKQPLPARNDDQLRFSLKKMAPIPFNLRKVSKS